MRLNVRLVEYQDKWKFCLVQNATCGGEDLLYSIGIMQEDASSSSPREYENNCWEETGAYLQAYSIFDMKVAGAVVRGVSIIYATTVGREDAIASVMMAPEADQVKISICPGVSKIT